MESRIVTRCFTARRPTGWYHQFPIGTVLKDCTLAESSELITCYAETLEQRERFEIDLPTLLAHTEIL